MRRAYVDTCIFIYWVEQKADEAAEALQWLANNKDAELCISPLIRLETLSKPKQLKQNEVVKAYEDLFNKQSWLPIDDATFARALDLRSKFGLKTPDSLHLAAAQLHGCDEFWTNDDRLNTAAGTMARNIFPSGKMKKASK
jgi:predicted nucleic acid-binding protein